MEEALVEKSRLYRFGGWWRLEGVGEDLLIEKHWYMRNDGQRKPFRFRENSMCKGPGVKGAWCVSGPVLL